MLRIISIPVLCLVILGSYSDIQSMTQTAPSGIPSLSSDMHGLVVACSQDRNALSLTCKEFYKWAPFARWKKLLTMFHTILHLSPQDQERIGAILLDEDSVPHKDSVPLMIKLLDRYPEYAKRMSQFAFDKPLSYATSPAMKQLLDDPATAPVKPATPQDLDALCHAAMTLPPVNVFDQFLAPNISGLSPEQVNIMQGFFGALEKGPGNMFAYMQSQQFTTLCEETSPVLTLAYRINNVFLLDNFGYLSAADKERVRIFYRAILKGDISYINNTLQSEELETLCGDNYVSAINYALQLAAIYGYYDIVELLLEQPALYFSEYPIWGQVLEAALGILTDGNLRIATKKMRPHEKIAQLIIMDDRIKDLPKYLDRVIQAGNPAIVKTLLEQTKVSPSQEDLALAKATGNDEIIKMVKDAAASKNSV